MLAVIVLGVVLATPDRQKPVSEIPVVFGDQHAWVVMDRSGRVLMRMHDVCGMEATELAVSQDRKTLVFTSWNEPTRNWLMFKCELGGSASMLGEPTGYHGQPAFSEDGDWVFFAHHPHKGGPPGAHEPGAYAQLYRIRVDGSQLEALTSSPGCKLGSRVARDVVVVVHLSCHGPRMLEFRRLSNMELLATTEEGQVPYFPDLAPDGRNTVFTRRLYHKAELVKFDRVTGKSETFWSLPAGNDEAHAVWGSGMKSVLYQRDGIVWRLSFGRTVSEERVAMIEREA